MTSVAPEIGTGVNLLRVEGVAGVPADQWNPLARRGFHLHGWFAGAERCGWRPRHVGVAGPDGLCAVVPAWLIACGAAHDLHDRWLGPLGGIASAAGLGLRPILSVQSPFAQCSEPLAEPGALPAALLHRVFGALEAEAEHAGARAVAWPFVDASRADLIGVARERGYGVFYAGVTARLRVEWPSFDDYVASRSKNVRRTIRADLRAFQGAALRTAAASDFRREAPGMDTLYRDDFRRRNGRGAPTPADLFERLAAPTYPACLALLATERERLVGMSLNVWTPRVLDGTFAAFSPEHAGGPAYYNDFCYEPVRLACRRGIAMIDLGASALYAKVLRGALLHRRMVLIRGTSPVAHRALSALGRLAGKRTAAKERVALGALGGSRSFAVEPDA